MSRSRVLFLRSARQSGVDSNEAQQTWLAMRRARLDRRAAKHRGRVPVYLTAGGAFTNIPGLPRARELPEEDWVAVVFAHRFPADTEPYS